jgi:hypothetical protein
MLLMQSLPQSHSKYETVCKSCRAGANFAGPTVPQWAGEHLQAAAGPGWVVGHAGALLCCVWCQGLLCTSAGGHHRYGAPAGVIGRASDGLLALVGACPA